MEEKDQRSPPKATASTVWPALLTGGLFWVLAAQIPDGVRMVRLGIFLLFAVCSLGCSLVLYKPIHLLQDAKTCWHHEKSAVAFLPTLFIFLSWGTTANLWFFFPDWSFPGQNNLAFEDSWILRSVLLFVLLMLVNRWAARFVGARAIGFLLVGAVVMCFWQLGHFSGFDPLYSVDHPSFYYRYKTFLEGFPDPGFYDPNWNAGQPVPYLVASGVWSIALIWLPFLALIPLEHLFTPMLGVTFLILVPASGYAAARLFGQTRHASLITALFFVVPGKRFFTHVLNYGTVPSMFCLCLVPLILACFWKVFHAEKRKDLGIWSASLTGVSLLVLCWPGSLLTSIPMGTALLTLWRRWTLRRILWVTGSAGILILLLTPLAVVPLRYSPISTFFDLSEPKTFAEILGDGRAHLADLVQGIHPLLLCAGIFGLWADPNRERRHYVLSFCFVSVFLSGWGEEIRPLLQSERLLIPATLVTAIPAGFLISNTLESMTQGGRLSRVVGSWMMVLMLLGAYQGARMYGNRGLMRTRVMPDYLHELVAFLSDQVPEGQRVLIAGKAVHAYGGGKVAALPLLINREMIASDYYGFSPKLVEYQCPPRRVLRQGPHAVLRYLDLHQVSHVMTYQGSWKAAFSRHPDWYQHLSDFGEISVYEVIPDFTPILGGEGRVEAEINRISVSLKESVENIILKYNWADGWHSGSEVELYPHEMEFGVTFIGIRTHGVLEIDLQFDP